MIDENEISTAIQRHLVDNLTGGYEVIFEGDDSVPARPYIVLQIVRLQPRAVMLEPHDGVHPQFLQATVVTEFGNFATQSLAIATEIRDLYPFGLRLPVGVGDHEITVNQIPFIENGFRDGADWRTPVRITYEVE